MVINLTGGGLARNLRAIARQIHVCETQKPVFQRYRN